MIDFTQCKIEPTKFYDGLNGKKIAIYHNDELYMLKFAKKDMSSDGYESSVINEHIASSIFKTLGFNAQDTLLGYYKNKIVVACKDFEGFDNRLVNFGKIKNSIIDSHSSSFVDTDLLQTLTTIRSQHILNPTILEDFYWEMFVADTLVANFDRHNGNWGVLADRQRRMGIAPIYDCGSSLYPKLAHQDIEKYLSNKGSLNDLLLNQTKSAITKDGKKINPQEFLADTEYPSVINALENIISKINPTKINSIIDDIEVISDMRKAFYKIILEERGKFLKHTLSNKYNRKNDNPIKSQHRQLTKQPHSKGRR